jgi:type IV pilus assembly protein PilV
MTVTTMTPNASSAPRQTGFTMLEVLVAVLIIAIGLLGLAGLQAVGLRNSQTAYLRTIATQQAYDISDRIRANLAGVAAGNYDAIDSTLAPNPAPDCEANTCSSAQLAQMDHAQWATNLGALLPGGGGAVDAQGNSVFRVTVYWTEQDMNGTTDANCPTVPNDLQVANRRCFVTSLQP